MSISGIARLKPMPSSQTLIRQASQIAICAFDRRLALLDDKVRPVQDGKIAELVLEDNG